MDNLITQILDIKTITLLIGGFFAFFQFSKQLKFRRLQNLSLLLHKFSENEDFLELFIDLDENNIEKIKQTKYKTKLAFLALIEEVALYSELSEVDKNYARYMFQWHFYFVFQSDITKEAFWSNIGGLDEMKMGYWDKSRKLSSEFIPDRT